MEVMVDLETASTQPDAAILAIGATRFDVDYDCDFYVNVSVESCTELGLHVCPNTMEWWEKQSDAAKESLKHNKQPITDALKMFRKWVVEQEHRPSKVSVWGNGAAFDNVILRSAFRAAGVDCPWPYYNDMCFRTISTLSIPRNQRTKPEIPHHALYDAKAQAKDLSRVLFKD